MLFLHDSYSLYISKRISSLSSWIIRYGVRPTCWDMVTMAIVNAHVGKKRNGKIPPSKITNHFLFNPHIQETYNEDNQNYPRIQSIEQIFFSFIMPFLLFHTTLKFMISNYFSNFLSRLMSLSKTHIWWMAIWFNLTSRSPCDMPCSINTAFRFSIFPSTSLARA